MSVAAALVLIAQSASPVVADTPASSTGSQGRRQVVAQVTASARVLRPAQISFDTENGVQISDAARNHSVQRKRDAAGTFWLEFS